MIELFSAIVGIVLVDLALSGDNALVIGAAAAGLPRRRRWKVIFFGGAAAILLRFVFSSFASFILLSPWLQAIGGLIVLLIAIRLLADRDGESRPTGPEQSRPRASGAAKHGHGLFSALVTVVVADITMSLDNVLAVGALSHGNLLILSVGLLVSMVILLASSALIAELMKWLPWLLDVAALVLAWTGAKMMLDDPQLGGLLNHYAWTASAVPVVSLGIVLGADVLLRLCARIQSQKVRILNSGT